MNLLIDAGGTNLTVYLVDKGKILDRKLFGQGNFTVDFDTALQNVKDSIAIFDIPNIRVLIFAAGWTNLTEKERNEAKSAIGSIAGVVSFYSDAFLPLVAYGELTIAITLGAGTAVAHNLNGEFETVFGYGHLIGDPLSGYALAQDIIFNILATGTKLQKQKLFDIAKVDGVDRMISKIHGSRQKTTVSDMFGKFAVTKELEGFVNQAIALESTLFFNDEVISLLRNSKRVVLNGTIANLEVIKQSIRKYVSSDLITFSEHDEMIIKASQNAGKN